MDKMGQKRKKQMNEIIILQLLKTMLKLNEDVSRTGFRLPTSVFQPIFTVNQNVNIQSMGTLQQIILNNKNNNLSVFFTAGFPSIDSTLQILSILNTTEVDFIEIGIPFSDPLADGPVIQHSSTIALTNRMTLELLFAQLEEARDKVTRPYLLMGYLNSLLACGIETFYRKCSEGGVHHIIIPDLPVNEYLEAHKLIADKFSVSPVFLITPSTSEARIKEIDKISNAFIYLVSGNTTTGSNSIIQTGAIQKIQKMNLKNPLIIGFGIRNKADYTEACKLGNGAIIGSAFISMISESDDLDKDIPEFIQQIKGK
jgi:tryptophan synthase alpha chain